MYDTLKLGCFAIGVDWFEVWIRSKMHWLELG